MFKASTKLRGFSLLQVTLDMLATDVVAELRAEVTRWWQNMQKQQQQKLKELNDDPNTKTSGNHVHSLSYLCVRDFTNMMLSGKRL